MKVGRIYKIDDFPWGRPDGSPESHAEIEFLEEGIFTILRSNEGNPRCTVTMTNGPVYQDSCMEFFFCPCPEQSIAYCNFGQSAYAAAKEGIRGLSRVAATEWGPDGINVNVVCPLAWTAKLEQFQQAYPDAFKANVKMPPMGHYGNAELEIGRVCVQLASPDFKFMSGETLTLEGGMGQRP